MNTSLHSPPRPLLLSETPFSQRKRTPFRAPQPPKAPAKSCPPVSRVFHTPLFANTGPHFVSFKSERKSEVFSSPVYDKQSQRSYFEQCFEVIEKLGEGSFGEVYKVRSREDGRLYAVKRSRQRFRGEWDRRQKLEEVEKHETLPPHPNCVQFHRAWEEKQHLYIQTELCQMSLSEYADLHGRIPEYRVWGFLIDLARGLKHLHDNRLCHFDIKPANIFIGGDGVTCKLGDFGLCVSLDEKSNEAMEGDAKYMAPELMRGNFGKPADVFSLGISLLEVSCDLELPSGGQNWHLLRQGQMPEHFTKDLSHDLVHALSTMMHPDPALRPTVDDIILDRAVQKAVYKFTLRKFFDRVVPVFKLVFSKLYGALMAVVLLLIVSVVPGRPSTPPADHPSHSAKVASTHIMTEDYFSDDDDGEVMRELASFSTDEGADPKAGLNCSWIRNSPLKYPSPVYAGPPIPLRFDSSCEASPNKSMKSSPLVLDHSYSSHNSSLSYTPNSQPTVDEAVSSKTKNINLGPRNLMEMFVEAGD